ncbi:conjugal transfer protein TraM [Legionella geestiana]|uniref:conjugal transfer protein TraM n=1 Tax=Legionella geestiana TaxID=45065 RepID=UPI00048FA780|nr:conjugal transfer protein TraM [Legionella geestiana]QBS13535.1 conjugal transfer protein TraM [Legionella geestiana]STX59181.1 traM [Legionella geestiana]
MTDQMQTLIKEIAVKHGVSVGQNDPILILQTLNARLMDDNLKAQQAMLDQYKEELEGIALRWGNDAKDKSERILNAALDASKDTMTKLLHDSAISTAMAVKKETEDLLARVGKSLRNTERVAMFNLVASCVTFLAACTVVIGMIFR